MNTQIKNLQTLFWRGFSTIVVSTDSALYRGLGHRLIISKIAGSSDRSFKILNALNWILFALVFILCVGGKTAYDTTLDEMPGRLFNIITLVCIGIISYFSQFIRATSPFYLFTLIGGAYDISSAIHGYLRSLLIFLAIGLVAFAILRILAKLFAFGAASKSDLVHRDGYMYDVHWFDHNEYRSQKGCFNLAFGLMAGTLLLPYTIWLFIAYGLELRSAFGQYKESLS